MSHPVNHPPQTPAGGQWEPPPQYQGPWGVPAEPRSPLRTGLVVTLVVVGVLLPASGFGLARWLLLGEDDYVPPPKPVHVGISSADLTLPETLEDGALVHDSAGMRPEGAEIWLYKAHGFSESQLELSIESDGQPTIDSVLKHGGYSTREKTIACQYSLDGIDIICSALLDDGRLIANFTDITTAGSPVSHPKYLHEAMHRTKEYLAEAQE